MWMQSIAAFFSLMFLSRDKGESHAGGKHAFVQNDASQDVQDGADAPGDDQTPPTEPGQDPVLTETAISDPSDTGGVEAADAGAPPPDAPVQDGSILPDDTLLADDTPLPVESPLPDVTAPQDDAALQDSGGGAGDAAPQGDFFVSADGKDTAAGTIDDPLASIDRAVELAGPGDVILVRGGIYDGPVSIWQGGEEGNPLTIMAYPGERPVIDGSGTPPNTDLVTISGSHVHFEGFEVTGATGTGISVWSAQNVTVMDNVIHDTVSGGIWVGADQPGISSGHLIEGNDVFDTVLENESKVWSEGWARAIGVDVSTDTIIRGNMVFENYGEGLGVLSSSDVQFVDNIAYDNYSVQMYFDNSQNITAKDNILFQTGNEEFYNNGNPGVGILIANEYTEYELATTGILVKDNIFAGVEPVYYDDSYGWGGGITDSVLSPNEVLAADDVDPDWLAPEELIF